MTRLLMQIRPETPGSLSTVQAPGSLAGLLSLAEKILEI